MTQVLFSKAIIREGDVASQLQWWCAGWVREGAVPSRGCVVTLPKLNPIHLLRWENSPSLSSHQMSLLDSFCLFLASDGHTERLTPSISVKNQKQSKISSFLLWWLPFNNYNATHVVHVTCAIITWPTFPDIHPDILVLYRCFCSST